MAEPRDSLERLAVQLEASGESSAAEQINAWLAELDKPEKAAPEKAASPKPTTGKTTTSKTKEA